MHTHGTEAAARVGGVLWKLGQTCQLGACGGEGIGVVRQESRGMEVSRGFGVGIEAISWVEESINLWSGNEVSGRMRGC